VTEFAVMRYIANIAGTGIIYRKKLILSGSLHEVKFTWSSSKTATNYQSLLTYFQHQGLSVECLIVVAVIEKTTKQHKR
jgi:hypothetical protein